jgi:hypothetical protein
MTVHELNDEQMEAVPMEDLREYAGQWVALRDGYFVAVAADPEALRRHSAVRPDDVLLPVPPGGPDDRLA